MPVKRIDLTVAPGHLVQTCACCGEEHVIELDRGAIETGPGPFRIEVGSGLDVIIDGGEPAFPVTFGSGEFPDFTAVTATQLAAKLNVELPGAVAIVAVSVIGRGDRVVIESRSAGPASSVRVVEGSAGAALGFPIDGPSHDGGRPVLGVSMNALLRSKDTIALRRCGSCGLGEGLRRTWDLCPAPVSGTPLHEQRRAINALAQHLKAEGWVHPDCEFEINAETRTPPDVAFGLPGSVLEPPVPAPVDLRNGAVPWGGVP